MLERDHAAVDQVLEPARGGDEDVGVPGAARLALDADAAVDGGDLERARVRERAAARRRSGSPARASGRARARRRGGRRGSMRSAIGMPKASVLPEPVGDWASTSWPASTSRDHELLDGEGGVDAAPARAATTGLDTPRSAKDCEDIYACSCELMRRGDPATPTAQERTQRRRTSRAAQRHPTLGDSSSGPGEPDQQIRSMRILCAMRRCLLAVMCLSLACVAGTSEARLPKDFFGIDAGELMGEAEMYMDGHARAMASGGLQVVRAEATTEMPPTPLTRAFYWVDEDTFELSLAAAGLRWYPFIAYAPLTFRGGGRSHPTAPKRIPDYAAFAAALARRYGPRGSFWQEHPGLPKLPVTTYEIWNEENSTAYWRPQRTAPEEYAELLPRRAQGDQEGPARGQGDRGWARSGRLAFDHRRGRLPAADGRPPALASPEPRRGRVPSVPAFGAEHLRAHRAPASRARPDRRTAGANRDQRGWLGAQVLCGEHAWR